MPQSQSVRLEEIIRATSESLNEHQHALLRARLEYAEMTAATRRTINESRSLMAEVDIILRRSIY